MEQAGWEGATDRILSRREAAVREESRANAREHENAVTARKGVASPAPGVIAVLAYNGRGVSMAMGAQIAARVQGAAPGDLAMPVTDLKTIPFHGLWRTAVSARMAYGRIRDGLGP